MDGLTNTRWDFIGLSTDTKPTPATSNQGFKVFKNDILIQNLIPCLDDNDVPCFYDSVNKQTHYNRGSGDFLYELL